MQIQRHSLRLASAPDLSRESFRLAILNHPAFEYLSRAIFIDYDDDVINTLNTRIQNIGCDKKALAVRGDFTRLDTIQAAISSLPKEALTLVFVDPTECNVPFSTLEFLAAELNKADFVINIPLGTDFRRNARGAVLDESFSRAKAKYAEYLGDEDFFDRLDVQALAKQEDMTPLCNAFLDSLSKKWSDMGFKCFDVKPVQHYYYLAFISKDNMGLSFWNKANVYDPDGQKTMF